MTCLVFSDSHGESRNILKAIEKNPDAEVVFFLGDGLLDIEEIAPRYPNIAFFAVMGNCDRVSVFRSLPVKEVDSITLLGKKILFTHGHKYGAKFGIGALVSLAEKAECDILLFGHTHEPMEKYISDLRPFYIFNPGSISGYNSSFGIIKISESGVLLSHGSLLGKV